MTRAALIALLLVIAPGLWFAVQRFSDSPVVSDRPEQAAVVEVTAANDQQSHAAAVTSANELLSGNAEDDGSDVLNASAPGASASSDPMQPGDSELRIPSGLLPGSMLRNALIRYLVDDGLSGTDSERIVGAALEGLTECRNRFPESAADLAACDRIVLQETGTYRAFRRLSTEVLDRFAE